MGSSAMWGAMTDGEVDRLPSLHRSLREPIEKQIVKFCVWCNLRYECRHDLSGLWSKSLRSSTRSWSESGPGQSCDVTMKRYDTYRLMSEAGDSAARLFLFRTIRSPKVSSYSPDTRSIAAFLTTLKNLDPGRRHGRRFQVCAGRLMI